MSMVLGETFSAANCTVPLWALIWVPVVGLCCESEVGVLPLPVTRSVPPTPAAPPTSPAIRATATTPPVTPEDFAGGGGGGKG
ncbi:hypothetical protein GCM10010470_25710 [Saccharopolyspora taberi]|uniref:Secreted protein n=1 Tax=Saccharopolyspora taberi TaxID=60895 RepID=A0ABN3VEW7_9PSEU